MKPTQQADDPKQEVVTVSDDTEAFVVGDCHGLVDPPGKGLGDVNDPSVGGDLSDALDVDGGVK